ncbi:MAG: pentapeptide repeat-containing protein [Gammaproteobacteria bacterium]|nr:pentapeptide repeat-containing protein [Gammaproteobacteria bacterium]
MANKDHINKLKNGANKWNRWRNENLGLSPDLRDVNFIGELSNKNEIYDLPQLDGFNFSNVDLHGASLRNGFYINCCFDGSQIHFADLVDTYFQACTFKNVGMRVTRIGSAKFHNCLFEDADLSYCSADKTSFIGSEFVNTKLEYISFISNDFTETKLVNCSVYGISSWDLNLENSSQKDLIITKEDHPVITVDNIELAQFLYLIINNTKLRNVIDTITSKVVLILGNFSKKTKLILDKIKNQLREYDFIPVMFDFDKPSSRNLTETVITLASMAKFVIADLSSSKSIPHELATIIHRLQSVNFYPIIVDGENEYTMFEEFKNFSWVKPIKKYNSIAIGQIVQEIVSDETKEDESHT